MNTEKNYDYLIWRNPHRFPFLLIDKVIKVEPSKLVIAEKVVSLNEPFYSSISLDGKCDTAFPSHLLIESFCQASGLALPEGEVSNVYLVSMSGVNVRHKVFAGDTIRHLVEVNRMGRNILIVSGESRVLNRIVVSFSNLLINFEMKG